MNHKYAHDVFCVCGHWNVKHRQMEHTVKCEFCDCTEFRPQIRNGEVLTPGAEQNMYDRAMRGEL